MTSSETEERIISIRHAFSQIVEPGYQRMVTKFRPLVKDLSLSTEVNVLCALALRITRLAISGRLLAEKGLDEEGQLPQRSATEAYVNLCYIFHTGPRLIKAAGPEKDTRGLCLQFCAYADLAYWKSIKNDLDRVRDVFRRRKGLSDPELDAMNLEQERLATEAVTIHGCTQSRWHATNLVDMARQVIKDPPPFADPEFDEMLLKSFVTSNSAVHADSLSIRSQYRDHGSDLMALIFKEETIRGDAVARLGINSWKAIGWYLNELDWVEKMITEQLGKVLKQRFDEAATPIPRTILVPDWLA